MLENLIEMISKGSIPVGQRLPSETDLAKQFNVSRPTVREAFRALELLGLVEVRHGSGSYIGSLNLIHLMELLSPLVFGSIDPGNSFSDIRIALETRAVELAAGRPRELIETLLLAPLAAMAEAKKNNDHEATIKANVLFHQKIFEATGNPIFGVLNLVLGYFIEKTVRINNAEYLRQNFDLEYLYNDHRRIYRALAGGDGAKAKRLMEKHLNPSALRKSDKN